MSEPLDRPVRSSRAEPAPVLAPGQTIKSVTDQMSAIVLSGRSPRSWYVGVAVTFVIVMVFLLATTYLFVRGTGIWGIMIPVGWGFAIVNFVWWIGIGHAGTLISAILLLFRQPWRTSINRFAEAMTLFAVACAFLFPLLHMGRPWFFYWMLPYPSTMNVWPGFRSPLVWDMIAIGTYGTVSLLFWYMGLVPDLATLRDRAKGRVSRLAYGILSAGWRNSARHWFRFEKAYFLMAALATPLVVSVHTIVSLDFAAGIVPGWHSTIFPPYFVLGALFSGFAMVLLITIPLRRMYHLDQWITQRHLDNMAKIMLVSGLGVAYGYLMEAFMGWYSGEPVELFTVVNRALGPYGALYWLLIACNIVIPQLLWFPRVRANTALLWVLSLVILTGMWLERFIIVVGSLARDWLPAGWAVYTPTIWDWITFAGTLGLFFLLLLLFIRFLPMISIFEMRQLVTREEEKT